MFQGTPGVPGAQRPRTSHPSGKLYNRYNNYGRSQKAGRVHKDRDIPSSSDEATDSQRSVGDPDSASLSQEETASVRAIQHRRSEHRRRRLQADFDASVATLEGMQTPSI